MRKWGSILVGTSSPTSSKPSPKTSERSNTMIKSITPFLWFDTQAEDAAKYYVSLFADSRILQTSHYGEHGPGPKRSVMVVSLELAGQKLIFLNAGPHFKLDEAFSLF